MIEMFSYLYMASPVLAAVLFAIWCALFIWLFIMMDPFWIHEKRNKQKE